MSHIDAIIDRIPSMNAKSRANLRENIGSTLTKEPEDESACRILDALNAFEEASAKPQRLEVTGLLGWEKRPHNKQFTFRAFHKGRVVGKIFKRANHSGTEKDVYTVEILEQLLPRKFHHIKDARTAGEAAFAEQYASNKFQYSGSSDPQDRA